MESFAVGHFIMHELCGVQLIIMIALIKNIPSFGKIFLRCLLIKSWFDTSYVAWRFGPFGSNTMAGFLTMNFAMSLRLNSSSWTPQWLRQGWLNMLRMTFSQPKLSLTASTTLGVLGSSFVQGREWNSNGIGKFMVVGSSGFLVCWLFLW